MGGEVLHGLVGFSGGKRGDVVRDFVRSDFLARQGLSHLDGAFRARLGTLTAPCLVSPTPCVEPQRAPW